MAISRTTTAFMLCFIALLAGTCHGGNWKLSWTICCAPPSFVLPTAAPGSTAGFAGEGSSGTNALPDAAANAMKAQIAAQLNVSVDSLCCVTLSTTSSGVLTLAVEVDDEISTPPPLKNVTITDGTNTPFPANGTEPRIQEVDDNNSNTTVIIIAVVFSVLGAILFAVMAYILYRKHKAEKEKAGVGAGIKPVARPTNDIAMTTTTIVTSTTTTLEIDEPATQSRKPIADEKARYLWNAAANAVSDPPPGGHPVQQQPKLAFVADELTS